MKTIILKHKSCSISAVFLIIVALMVQFLIRPEMDRLNASMDRIQEKIIDHETDKARLDKIPEMEKAHQDYLDNARYVDVILSQSSEVDFIKSLEDLADKTENKIAIKINDPQKKDAPKKKGDKKEEKGILDGIKYDKYIPMEISLEGDYRSSVDFIHQAENLPYYLNIMNIAMKKEDRSRDNDSQQGASNFGTIFYSTNTPKAVKLEQQEEKGEILKSTINVILYLRK